MATQLEVKLRDLAIARHLREEAELGVKAKEDALHQTLEWQALENEKAGMAAYSEAVTVADAAVREELTNYFTATGDKKPTPGAEVQMHKKLVYDQDEVMRWCENNAPMMVEHKLLVRKFEAVAEKLGAPVETTFEPRTVLATNLNGYLPDDMLAAIAEQVDKEEEA